MTAENDSLRARVFGGHGWSTAFVEGALIHDLWKEIERLRAWRDRVISVPSPSSVCGVLGCQNPQFHVHDVVQDDVSVPKEEKIDG